MDTAQIRANKQLTSRLKQLIVARGNKESMANLISYLVEQEMKNYGYTQDGLAKPGDYIRLANTDRELTNITKKIVCVNKDGVIFSDGSIVESNGRIMFFSKIHKRGDLYE